MNINQIFYMLRRKNIAEYILYMICTIFSVAVVSAYALLLFSPTVMEVLPVGGDSRKQAFGIFAVVCIGCLAFSMYASALFYKKKQKELGIILALGGNRSKLYRTVVKENLRMSLLCLLVGLLLAFPLNKGIWGALSLFIDSPEMKLRVELPSLLISVGIAGIVLLSTMLILRRIIFRMDLLDVIKAEHKNEMVRKLPKHTGLYGMILILAGGVISYLAPGVYMDVFSEYPPAWLNLLYLIPLAGVYLTILYAVVGGEKVEKKHYADMISKSIMKFQGRQTVNCMLVITLLIGGGCFAAFYVPITMTAFGTSVQAKEWNYQYSYPQTRDVFEEGQLEELVKKYGAQIQEEKDFPVLLAAKDGMQEIEEGRKFHYEYHPRMATVHLIKESDFEEFTETKLQIKPDEYYAITDEEEIARFDPDMTLFSNMETREEYPVKFAGCLHHEDLVLENSRLYLISDALFDRIDSTLSQEWKETLCYRKIANDSYELATKVYEEFCRCFEPQDMVFCGYDRVSAIVACEAGQEYWAAAPEFQSFSELSPDSPEFQREWIYMPFFKIMSLQGTLRNYAVYFMLFIYVVIVALVSAWLIAYTRCVTIGMHNRYVFEALEKLGASTAFRQRELRKQLSIVYKTPTCIGLVVVLLLFVLILYGNDGGRFSKSELLGLLICVGIEAVIGAITYVCYRASVRKVSLLSSFH